MDIKIIQCQPSNISRGNYDRNEQYDMQTGDNAFFGRPEGEDDALWILRISLIADTDFEVNADSDFAVITDRASRSCNASL